jgi:dynein heavy chain
MEECALSYPIKWEESMNTVITQELERFNSLNAVIKKSLTMIGKAVVGEVVSKIKNSERCSAKCS